MWQYFLYLYKTRKLDPVYTSVVENRTVYPEGSYTTCCCKLYVYIYFNSLNEFESEVGLIIKFWQPFLKEKYVVWEEQQILAIHQVVESFIHSLPIKEDLILLCLLLGDVINWIPVYNVSIVNTWMQNISTIKVKLLYVFKIVMEDQSGDRNLILHRWGEKMRLMIRMTSATYRECVQLRMIDRQLF